MPQLLHATCLEIEEVGCLLIGDPGSGKSSLAADLMAAGAKLVADDQVILNACNRMITARAPESLHSIIELGGLGVVSSPRKTIDETAVELVFQCHANPELIERLPEPKNVEWLGINLPCYDVAPAHFATASKLKLFCQAWREGRITNTLSTEGAAQAS